MRRLFLFLFVLFCSIASADVAIRAGNLIDVRSGKVSSNVFIIVSKDHISSIAAAAPQGVSIIDLSRYTVLPGLVESHSHLLFNWKDLSSVQPLRLSSGEATLWGQHNLQTYLDKGFTTVRDAGEPDLGYSQLALREFINNGMIQGPRLVTAGNFISVTGGHGDADILAPDQALPRRPNLADTVDEVAIAVRHELKYGVDWIKLMATGGVMDPWSDYNVQELSDEQMQKAVELAHRAGKKVMAHAEGTAGIKAAVRAGVDSIEHGTCLDEEGAALMAKQGTWLVPTLFTFQDGMDKDEPYAGMDPVSFQKAKAILKCQQPAFDLALKYKLKIAYGVDDNPEKAHRELAALVKGGMKPIEALQAATINGAELLGMADQIGSIESGKYADIIALAGNPLSDPTALEHVVFVMKGGEVFKNETAK